LSKSLRDAASWLELPGALLSRSGVIRLREPAGSDVSHLLAQLRSGRYRKPFLLDDGQVRRLHFGLRYVQSEINLATPQDLSFAYLRKMMAFLLFQPQPRALLVVGLGGGSLAGFCHRQLPHAHITALEIDADVIGFSRWFGLPQRSKRLRLLHADAVDYLAHSRERMDVILVDGCDRRGVAPAFRSAPFYRDVHRLLNRDGLLVMNLIGGAAAVDAHLRLIAGSFGGRVIVLRASAGGNRLVFAFRNPRHVPDWSAIEQAAPALATRHGLDFPGFARKLRRSTQFQAMGGG